MSSTAKLLLVLGATATIAACARREPEPEFIAPAPVVAEPTYSKI